MQTDPNRPWLNKEIADTTYFDFNDQMTELRIHTLTKRKFMTGKQLRYKHTKIIRIKAHRSRPGTIAAHMTIFRGSRTSHEECDLPFHLVGSAFAVPGYDEGKGSAFAREKPGATHAVRGWFIRDSEYVNFVGGWFKLLPDIARHLESLMTTGKF